MAIWNPWHGCHKKSSGCLNCYMFARDALYDIDSTKVRKTKDFDLALRKNKKGEYVLKDEEVYLCMTSDFFVAEADEWRKEIFTMIKMRKDLHFHIITKRIERFDLNILKDDPFDNITLCPTCEDQRAADERLPILLKIPLKHKEVILEPLLEKVDIEKYLATKTISQVTCGGESGQEGRLCDYEWVLSLREQCLKTGTRFYFKQTGTHFKKDGKVYTIDRKYQLSQANKANINIL